MAGEPTDPKGPGSNQPIDPGVSNVFERMESKLADVNMSLVGQEKLLKAMAEHAGAVATEADKASDKLKDQFRLVSSLVDKYKQLQNYAKKRSEQGLKEFQNAEKARKELEEMSRLYEEALAGAKANTREASLMQRNLAKIRDLMRQLPKEGELSKDQVQVIADAFERASHNAKDLVKSMNELGRTGATIKGIAGIFGAMGIGRGLNAHI